MLRYDTAPGAWGDVARTAGLARALIEAGAPVDGATALDLCRAARARHHDRSGFDRVEVLLTRATGD